ncbi:MAG: hypothetical protein NT107_08855 [Planctomycetota bacterium]|nr:hypothetical protein [Planctomycetota bacterium]
MVSLDAMGLSGEFEPVKCRCHEKPDVCGPFAGRRPVTSSENRITPMAAKKKAGKKAAKKAGKKAGKKK